MLAEAGLAGLICSKANIPNELERRSHFEHKHPMSYKVLEDYKKNKKEAEDRAMSVRQLDAMIALATKAAEAPAPAPKTAKKAEEE